MSLTPLKASPPEKSIYFLGLPSMNGPLSADLKFSENTVYICWDDSEARQSLTSHRAAEPLKYIPTSFFKTLTLTDEPLKKYHKSSIKPPLSNKPPPSNKPPLFRGGKLISPPSLLSPPSKVLEKNKPPGGLNRGFTVP